MFRRLRYPMHPPAAALAVTEHADNPHARAVSCGAYSVAEKAAQHARLQQRFVPDRVAESAREDTLADLLPGDAPVRQQQFDSCLNGPLRKLKFSDIALVQRHFACLRFTEDAAQLRPFPADTAGKGRRRPALHRAILVEHTLPQKQRDGVDEHVEAEADRIEYDSRAGALVFTGNAAVRRLRAGAVADEITGGVIRWDDAASLFSVEGSAPGGEGGRVRAVLTPPPPAEPASTVGPASPPAEPASTR